MGHENKDGAAAIQSFQEKQDWDTWMEAANAIIEDQNDPHQMASSLRVMNVPIDIAEVALKKRGFEAQVTDARVGGFVYVNLQRGRTAIPVGFPTRILTIEINGQTLCEPWFNDLPIPQTLQESFKK